jgi:hypothetical protein
LAVARAVLLGGRMKSVVRVCCLVLLLAFGAVGCVDGEEPETDEEAQALVIGAPRIISTTINAPFVNGRYQLIASKAYTATVVVDAGTITYLTRVEANGSATAAMIGNQYRDDTVIAYTGRYVYTFPLSTSTTGNRQVAFQVRDRGTWNVYNWDAGVPVTVSSAFTDPRIVSTTIDGATMLDGRYLLYAGQSYTVRVTVGMSNVTYSARVEAYNLSPSLRMTPYASSYQTMPRFGADRVYTFTITPDTTGYQQIAFRLRDAPAPTGTGNAFAQDGGIGVTIGDGGAPRIISTTITGVTPRSGQYVLTIGKRYDVVVRVARGAYVYNAAVAVRHPVAASANLHNNRSHFQIIDGTKELHFTMTPTEVGTYPISFQMLDSGTGNLFHPDGGITVVAAAPDAPHVGDLYGRVTRVSDGAPVIGVPVRLDGGPPISTGPDGWYFFSSVSPGPHRVLVDTNPTLYSPTTAVNVTVPAAGIRVDLDLEEPFMRLRNAGMPYERYIDYAHGRTLFHAVRVSASQDRVEILPSIAGDKYETSAEIAQRLAGYGNPDPAVAINGGYFDYVAESEHRCGQYHDYLAVGFAYYGLATAICELTLDPNFPSGPTLGITNIQGGQWHRMVEKTFLFTEPSWRRVDGVVTWDDNNDGLSDVDYAVQMDGWLVRPPVDGKCAPGYMKPDGNTCVWANEPADSLSDSAAYWARTAVGVDLNGNLLLVVADGESLPGRQGASFYQLGQMFAHTLGGVATAMAMDGGGSTQMAIYSEREGKYRIVNGPTSERQSDTGTAGARVLNFILAWSN